MKTKKIMLICITLVLGLTLFTSLTEAYSVNPAKWKFYLKENYELQPIAFDLKVHNDENDSITVQISVIPAEYLYDNYTEIPDRSWVKLEQNTVVVPGNSDAYAHVTITIPDTYQNGSMNISAYNQSFETWLFVHQTDGPGNFRTDYKCRWMIDTPLRYVPAFERPGYFTMPIGIIAVIIVVAVILLVRRNLKNKEKREVKRR